MNSNFFDLVLFSGAIHGLLFNVVTLTYAARKKITKTILYLNVVVLSISLNNIQAWMVSKDVTLPGYFLQHFEVPWYFFVVPMFYCFLLYFLRLNKKGNALVIGLLLVFFGEIFIRAVVIGYCHITASSTTIIEHYRQVEEGLNATISFFYLYKSYRIVFKRREEYSLILSFDSLSWLRNFMRIGFVVFIFWIYAIVLNQYYSSVKLYYPLRLSSTILIYWIGYQGLIRYVVMKDRIQLRNRIKKRSVYDVQKNAKTAYLDTPLREVKNFVLEQQLFLNPKLSIEDVAEALSMSISKLSKLINTHSTKHFTDLINQLRINYAKELLHDKDFNNYTIEAIGLESGFNSKSAFYNAFKKNVGNTPSMYRKVPNKHP